MHPSQCFQTEAYKQVTETDKHNNFSSRQSRWARVRRRDWNEEDVFCSTNMNLFATSPGLKKVFPTTDVPIIWGEELDTLPDVNESNASEPSFQMNSIDVTAVDDFRIAYLRKLSYSNIWIPNSRKPPQHQTVIIFDWDDTLLCTSYINLYKNGNILPPDTANFKAIENYALLLLEMAIQIGRVFIITNATEEWIEYSSKKYLPAIVAILEKVTIISARALYEDKFPGEYYQWKVQGFLEVQRQLNSEIITNLICVGDSNLEMDAVHVMGREFSEALVKTIKFRENPLPVELEKQLELLLNKFQKICHNARNLKIQLERKPTNSVKTESAVGVLNKEQLPDVNSCTPGISFRKESDSTIEKSNPSLSALGVTPLQLEAKARNYATCDL